MKWAVVFPGQGSQHQGMGRELAEQSEVARQVWDRVSTAIGFDVAKLCFEGTDEELRQTDNTQIALFTCSAAAWLALDSAIAPIAFAGHSVGEYAALFASGVLTLEDGARLVRRRGQLMARAGSTRAGAMAAVLMLDRQVLESICATASSADEVVVIANDNSPGQLVISGDQAAVQRASDAAKAAAAKRVLPLPVSGAFHSPLMDELAAEFREDLDRVTFSKGSAPIYSNVTAQAVTEPGLWPDLLETQLKSPVRWTESVQHMVAAGAEGFVECGAGEVLSGLIRRIDSSVNTRAVGSPESVGHLLSESAGAIA